MATKLITIAFDVMGSDHGPAEVVRGAAQLSLESPHIHTLLVGDRALIDDALAETKHSGERISVQHASEFIGMDEKPGEALVRKPDASVSVAARLVAEGEADALVSAGNTGACVLSCARHFQLLPGVRRAALAAVSGDLTAVERMRQAFDRRRRTMVEMLSAIEGLTVPVPHGAFYAYPSMEALVGRSLRGTVIDSSATLAGLILEHAEVALVPGEAFGPSGFLRLSYALGDEELVEGIGRLQKLLA